MLIDILAPLAVMGALGGLFGIGLAIASKKLSVPVDERVAAIHDALPGANCGGCGKPGCEAFAAAVVAGEAPTNGCPVGGSRAAAIVASIMGVEAGTVERQVAEVICRGTTEKCKQKFEYAGLHDCSAASLAAEGPRACRYACVGMGNCARTCPFNAINMRDGIAYIDHDKCTACGRCVAACPKNVMRLVPLSEPIILLCRAHEKGKIVRDACLAGCIGCGRCARTCPSDAIALREDLPAFDLSKCVSCGACVGACPTGAIALHGISKAEEIFNENT